MAKRTWMAQSDKSWLLLNGSQTVFGKINDDGTSYPTSFNVTVAKAEEPTDDTTGTITFSDANDNVISQKTVTRCVPTISISGRIEFEANCINNKIYPCSVTDITEQIDISDIKLITEKEIKYDDGSDEIVSGETTDLSTNDVTISFLIDGEVYSNLDSNYSEEDREFKIILRYSSGGTQFSGISETFTQSGLPKEEYDEDIYSESGTSESTVIFDDDFYIYLDYDSSCSFGEGEPEYDENINKITAVTAYSCNQVCSTAGTGSINLSYISKKKISTGAITAKTKCEPTIVVTLKDGETRVCMEGIRGHYHTSYSHNEDYCLYCNFLPC